MKLKIVLEKGEDGYIVASVPSLPGCHSQGKTKQEALKNIREAISQSIDTLIESVKEVLETTPPEVLSDVMQRGIYLVGGGALIKGLAEIIAEYTKIVVHIAADPLTAVCRGTGIILDNIDLYKEVLIANEDELPPKK